MDILLQILLEGFKMGLLLWFTMIIVLAIHINVRGTLLNILLAWIAGIFLYLVYNGFLNILA